ncbi:MAG TPA: sulfite exporter TauE/SafE family protein [Methylomirabilota bacterium]|nr:sulfite exporter TauE/SafE family protein [Methylomirabilota bacterium]
MTAPLALALVGIGFVGAFLAGFLGIGGALVMFPLLLYGPPALGVGALGVRDVVGVTMALVFVTAVSGFLAHRRYGAVNRQLAVLGGIAATLGSFVGALASKWTGDQWLLIVYAVMATAGAILILIPGGETDPKGGGDTLRFDPARIILVSGGVGVAAGFVGAGGAFLLVPLLVVVVGVPVRVTIASSLAITSLTGVAGFVGKLVTHQIPFVPALTVAVGAIPGAQLGAAASHRVSSRHLKWALAITIVLAAMRVWWDVIQMLTRG